jgi:diguanylate cyclase (GGDEF)-like protein/PAS domain S-box-containing protein
MSTSRISYRLGLWLVLLSLLPIVLLALSYLQAFETQLTSQVERSLALAADRKVAIIDAYIDERLHDSHLLARSPETGRALISLDAVYREFGPDSKVYQGAEGEYRGYFARLIDDDTYYDVLLVNAAGEVVFSVLHESDYATNLFTGPQRGSELAQSVRETFAVLGSDISDFRFYAPSGKAAAFISTPVLAEGRLFGAVVLQVDAGPIHQVVTDDRGLGASGETLVVQRQGDDLVYMAPTHADPGAGFERRLQPDEAIYPAMLAAVNAERGHGLLGPDQALIAAWRYLPALRWGMVVRLDRAEALAPVQRLRSLGILIMAMAMLSVLFAAFFLGRSIVRPLAQLSSASSRIAAGDLGRRVPVGGFAEARQLGTSFNTMADHLQSAQQDLEQRVGQRTAELAASNERLQREMAQRAAADVRLRQAAKVFDNTSEAILITDRDFLVIDTNQAYREVSGYDLQDLIGRLPHFADDEDDDRRLLAEIRESVEHNGKWSGELRNRRNNGEVYPIWLRVDAVTGEGGEIVNYVAIFSDISHIKEAEQRLEKLAYYDFLTGLPNRLLFRERLQRAIAAGRRGQKHTALLFIDLDRFKLVNDSLGHDTGDKLLLEISRRLQDCVRGNDTVARLGGDEFTIILGDLGSAQDASHIARKVLEAIAEPIRLKGHDIVTGGSIGIAVAPQDGQDQEILIANADIAMYHAKDKGRGNFQFFTEAMNRHTREQLLLETGLRQALHGDELELLYQPLVNLENRMPVGLEVLLRWHHPQRGTLAPDQFLGVAEDTGLILELGDWVLEQACRQAQRWIDAGLPALMLAVNLSRRQFQDPELGERITRILTLTGTPPQQIQFEISENVAIDNPEQVAETLEALTAMGLNIALDDFGTGHSSLTLLRRFQTCCLKIDRSFIADLPDDADACAITSAVITLATSLGLEVVAEGVETEAQRSYLIEQGCSHAQGYLFAGALDPAGVEVFLAKYQRG